MALFKDVYKNANDRINTKEPYERLMKKLEKAPKRKISIVKRAEYAAALAACVCLTFVGVNVYNNKAKDAPVENIKRNLTEKIKTAEPAYDMSSADKEMVLGTEKPQKTEEKVRKENKTQKINKEVIPEKKPQTEEPTNEPENISFQAQAVAEEVPIIQDELQEQDVPSPTPKTVPENGIMTASALADSAEPEEKISSGGGGGGGNSRMISGDTKTATYDEFCESLGRKINMPKGYLMTSPDNIEGELPKEWQAEFENGLKRAKITFGENIEKVENHLKGYEISNISGTEAVIIEGDAEFSVYMKAQGVCFEISTENINKEELEEIIKALSN